MLLRMKITFFRHAEKNNIFNPKTPRDPELSVKGHSQAQNLLSLVQSKQKEKPDLILVSPRIRAIQTMQPLSQTLSILTHIEIALQDRQHNESSLDFDRRIQKFLNDIIEYSNQHIYVCSHMDWLDTATQLIENKSYYWKSGHHITYDIRENEYYFLCEGDLE